jgi:PAS domain-containing protein
LLQTNGFVNLKRMIGEGAEDFLARSASEGATIETLLPSPEASGRPLSFRGSPIKDRRGQVTATVFIVSDLTLQKRERHTLAAWQQSLQYLVKHSSDPIVRFSADMKCLFVNSAFEASIEVSASSFIGKHIAELERFRPLEAWQHAIQRALATGQPTTFESQGCGDTCSKRTHVIPEPARELEPTSVLCLISQTD